MDVRTILLLAAQLSLFLLVLGIGLQSRWQDLTYVLARPRLLLNGVVAAYVIPPVIAVLLCQILPIPPHTKVGLIVMAVSPMAPLAPGKMFKAGADRSFVVGAYLALTLVAIVSVPATIAMIDVTFPARVGLPISAIAGFLFRTMMVPIVLGVAIGSQWPSFGQQAARLCTIFAFLVLLPLLLLIVVKSGPALADLFGDGSVTAIVVTIIAALAAGHWLGGPSPKRRMALAQAAATRHPGIAALIANLNFEDRRIILAVLLFMLVSIVVSGIYHGWSSRRLQQGQPYSAAGSAPT